MKKSLVSKKASALLQQETGFTLSVDSSSKKVEAGEAASWVFTFNPSSGFEGEITLSASGSPPNSALILLPNTVRLFGGLEGQATLKVITTSQSPPGTYLLTMAAVSDGSQINAPVVLEVVDFSLSMTPAFKSIQQLDEAVFSIKTAPLGPFEGPLSFSINGIPNSMRAELSATEALPGEEVAFQIFTSKKVTPVE